MLEVFGRIEEIKWATWLYKTLYNQGTCYKIYKHSKMLSVPVMLKLIRKNRGPQETRKIFQWFQNQKRQK